MFYKISVLKNSNNTIRVFLTYILFIRILCLYSTCSITRLISRLITRLINSPLMTNYHIDYSYVGTCGSFAIIYESTLMMISF